MSKGDREVKITQEYKDSLCSAIQQCNSWGQLKRVLDDKALESKLAGKVVKE